MNSQIKQAALAGITSFPVSYNKETKGQIPGDVIKSETVLLRRKKEKNRRHVNQMKRYNAGK